MSDHPNRLDHPNEETNEKQSPRGQGGEQGSTGMTDADLAADTSAPNDQIQ